MPAGLIGCIATLLLVACAAGEPGAGQPGPASLVVQGPVFAVPVDPLVGKAVSSCAVFGEERCSDGQQQRCAVYDVETESFPANVDPLLARAYLFDRWYDLYHAPDGQTAERRFTEGMATDAAESYWGDAARFASFEGYGDSALWTGMALNGHMMRYLSTGTEADYARFEDKARALISKFEVTGIPGYLARYHGVSLPNGTPADDQHIVVTGLSADSTRWHFNRHAIKDVAGKNLPAIYTDPEATPFWWGNPSIDSYSGPTSSLAATWGLLRDADLKDAISRHMTCYLKRMRRLEIINLQQNEDGRQAIQNLFAGGALDTEPGDFDFGSLDRIVGYYQDHLNSVNERFDPTCPETITRTPTRVIDAADDTHFLFDMLMLAQDLDSGNNERETGIDHAYFVTLRGADAIHMLNLTAMAYYFTGEQDYLDFFNELWTDLDVSAVASTLSALIVPKWCRSYEGEHRSFVPLWAFLNLLADSPFREKMRLVMHTEVWQKSIHNLRNAKFDILYAATAPEENRDTVAHAVEEALDLIEITGGNGGVLDAPRRNYGVSRDEAIALLPFGVDPVCPTETERSQCEDGFDFLGIHIEGQKMTWPCNDEPNECRLGDVCAEPMASVGIPPALRQWTDHIWQRNPFALGRAPNDPGIQQTPGLDVTEPYWLARHYGYIDSGSQALAWQAMGDCP